MGERFDPDGHGSAGVSLQRGMDVGSSGATVRTAGSGEEAMQLFQSRRPDVLVSDIGMPTEDGYCLMRRIRALPRADGGSVPAIALTAYARRRSDQSDGGRLPGTPGQTG